jgi:hypothetical protein
VNDFIQLGALRACIRRQRRSKEDKTGQQVSDASGDSVQKRPHCLES